MKKTLLRVLGGLAAPVILATGVGPHLILSAVHQEKPAETAWREKTVEDFKVATRGVLNTRLK